MVKTMSYEALSVFFNDLSIMINSGSTMEENLTILSNDSENAEIADVLRLMADDVGEGESLYTAMINSGAFPGYAVNMVNAGIAAGKLDEVTAALSEFYARREKMRQTIISALVRPLILLVLLAAILGAFVAYILPLLSAVYTAMGGDAGMYISGSYAVGVTAFALICAMIVFLAIFGTAFRRKGGNGPVVKRLWHNSFLTKDMALAFEQAYFISDVTTRISGGLMPDRAFAAATENVSDDELKGKLGICNEKMAAGESMSTVILEERILPAVCTHIIYSLSRSGRTEQALESVGEILFNTAEGLAENTVRRIEPVITGFFTVATGVSLLSVILPLIGIISAI